MKLVCKTTAFMMGVAVGLYFAMNYDEEIEDFSRSCAKAKRKMKRTMCNMDRFFD